MTTAARMRPAHRAGAERLLTRPLPPAQRGEVCAESRRPSAVTTRARATDSARGAERGRSQGRRLPRREGGDGPRLVPADAERTAPGVQPDVEPRPDRGVGRPHGREHAAVAEVDGPRPLRPPVPRRPHGPLPPRRRRALAAVEGRARRARCARAARAADHERGAAPAPSGSSDPTTARSRRSSTCSRRAAPSRSRPASLDATASASRAGREALTGEPELGRHDGGDRTAHIRRRHRAVAAARRRRARHAGGGARAPTWRATSPSCGCASSASNACSGCPRTSVGRRDVAGAPGRRTRAPGCSCSSACPVGCGPSGNT